MFDSRGTFRSSIRHLKDSAHSPWQFIYEMFNFGLNRVARQARDRCDLRNSESVTFWARVFLREDGREGRRADCCRVKRCAVKPHRVALSERPKSYTLQITNSLAHEALLLLNSPPHVLHLLFRQNHIFLFRPITVIESESSFGTSFAHTTPCALPSLRSGGHVDRAEASDSYPEAQQAKCVGASSWPR